MGKHPFRGFAREEFALTARNFWYNGYLSVDMIRDMDAKERDLFLQEIKRDSRGSRPTLSDMRLTLKIFAWYEPHGRMRTELAPFTEVCIGERMKKWSVDLSRIATCLEPDQDMVNYFSAQLEAGRTSRPPLTPYITTDTLTTSPWMPTDEPHSKAHERWRMGQKSFNRFTGDQDLGIGQYVLYRMRFVLAGDLTGAWADFGGLQAQMNFIYLITDLSITDHPGIALTYEKRIHRHIQKLAQKRVCNTDYFNILSVIQPDIRAGVLRDFESNTLAIKKEKEAEKAKKGKGADPKATAKATTRKPWTPDEWAAWKKTQREQQTETKTDETTKQTDEKPVAKAKQPHPKKNG